MTIEDCYHLGYVAKVHGINGEVLVVLDVDRPEEYRKLESVFVEINNQLVPFFIKKISIQKEKAIIHFEDVDNLDQADELIGTNLYLSLKSLPKLKDDQFYFHEITDFEVVDKNLGLLGKVTTVYTLPHQDLIAMEYKEKEVLIPINDHTVLKIDRTTQQLFVELPEGLLEIYLED